MLLPRPRPDDETHAAETSYRKGKNEKKIKYILAERRQPQKQHKQEYRRGARLCLRLQQEGGRFTTMISRHGPTNPHGDDLHSKRRLPVEWTQDIAGAHDSSVWHSLLSSESMAPQTWCSEQAQSPQCCLEPLAGGLQWSRAPWPGVQRVMCCETDFLSYVEQAATDKFQVVVAGHWQDAQLCNWNLCGEPGSLRQVDKQE